MTFAIGQKVMCIKPKYRAAGRFNTPKFMQIYTVRAYCSAADIPSILLEELHNREVVFIRTRRLGEASFAEYHFRALEDINDEVEQECEA